MWPLIDDMYGAFFPDEPKRVRVINPGNGMLDPSRPSRRVRDIERFTFLNTQHGTSVYKQSGTQPPFKQYTTAESL